MKYIFKKKLNTHINSKNILFLFLFNISERLNKGKLKWRLSPKVQRMWKTLFIWYDLVNCSITSMTVCTSCIKLTLVWLDAKIFIAVVLLHFAPLVLPTLNCPSCLFGFLPHQTLLWCQLYQLHKPFFYLL